MARLQQGWAPQRGLLSRLLQQSPKFHDGNTPPSETGGTMPLSQWGRRVTWVMHENETLLDSSNMDQADWLNIAKLIYANYNSGYDGFVLIQGTDTLTYTSSCLSFILKYLSKTVVITGSQVPMVMQPNDAEANLFGSINIAAHFEARGRRCRFGGRSRVRARPMARFPKCACFSTAS